MRLVRSDVICAYELNHLSLAFLTPRPPPRSRLFPYTTLFRSLKYGSCWSIRTLRCSSSAVRSSSVMADLTRSEEHTSELQSPVHLVCRLLLEKKKILKHSEVMVTIVVAVKINDFR